MVHMAVPAVLSSASDCLTGNGKISLFVNKKSALALTIKYYSILICKCKGFQSQIKSIIK